MKTQFFGIEIPLAPELVWPGFLLLAGLVGLLVGHILRLLFVRLSSKTKNFLDDVLAASFGWPVNLSLGCITILIAAGYAPIYDAEDLQSLSSGVRIAVLLFAVVGSLRFADRWIDFKAQQNAGLQHTVGIFKPLFRVLILCVGTLIVITELGYSILPIITGLGVGGVAVALAAQPTLANFFAGITLVGERQVSQGNFIHLDSGLEGWVRAINWRSTLIETREHKVVIIPNLKLSESIITNFHLPKSWIIVPIPIGVSYAADPETVERVVLEEVEALSKEHSFILMDPPPTCRFHPGYGESSLDFTLRFSIESFERQFDARDLVRKRVFLRFRKEGIEIPFPQRDVHIKEMAKES